MLFVIAIVALGLLTGGMMVWYCRGRACSLGNDVDPPDCCLDLWDPHSCLNALNRCIFERNDMERKDQPVYIVAAHLQMLVVTSKFKGWATPQQLHPWLMSLLDLHQYLHPADEPPTYKVILPDELLQLELAPLGNVLIPLLGKIGPVSRVTIECERVHTNGSAGLASLKPIYKAKMLLRLRVTGGIKPPASTTASPPPAPSEERVDVACNATFGVAFP
jgi:hypothetical protein